MIFDYTEIKVCQNNFSMMLLHIVPLRQAAGHHHTLHQPSRPTVNFFITHAGFEFLPAPTSVVRTAPSELDQ